MTKTRDINAYIIIYIKIIVQNYFNIVLLQNNDFKTINRLILGYSKI